MFKLKILDGRFKPCSEETKNKISLANKGHVVSLKQRLEISNTLKKYFRDNPDKINPGGFKKGFKPNFSEEHREKIRQSKLGKNNGMFGRKQDKSPNWKGGITPKNKIIRGSLEYRNWKNSVMKRDDYTCQICFKRGGIELHADHIKQFAYYPELRFELSNGRTLCKECHVKTPTYKKRIKNESRD